MHVYILLKITTKFVGLSKCFILIFGVKDLNKEVIPFPPWEPTIRVAAYPILLYGGWPPSLNWRFFILIYSCSHVSMACSKWSI